MFEVVKLGEEYFTFVVDCADPKARAGREFEGDIPLHSGRFR